MVHMVRKLHKDEPFPKPNQIDFIYLFIYSFYLFIFNGGWSVIN